MNPSDNKYIAQDLLSIGKEKPLGYLPIDTITSPLNGGYDGILQDAITEVEMMCKYPYLMPTFYGGCTQRRNFMPSLQHYQINFKMYILKWINIYRFWV